MGAGEGGGVERVEEGEVRVGGVERSVEGDGEEVARRFSASSRPSLNPRRDFDSPARRDRSIPN